MERQQIAAPQSMIEVLGNIFQWCEIGKIQEVSKNFSHTVLQAVIDYLQ